MRSSVASEESSSSTEAEQPSLTAYRTAYSKADKFCREVQHFIEEAGIPAINEMRYAGYHLLEALDDQGAIVSRDELTRATNHAKRACYEAGEAGILCALDRIAAFKNDYRHVFVSVVVADYTAILRAAEDAKDRLVADRDHGADGAADHEDFIAIFGVLKGHCRTLDLSREELNKLAMKERREARRFVITSLLALAAVIATATGAYYAFKAIA